jgi:hypothetical protein
LLGPNRDALNEYNKYLRDFNAQSRAIRMHPTMDADTKRERLDEINRRKNKMLTKAAKLIDRLELK